MYFLKSCFLFILLSGPLFLYGQKEAKLTITPLCENFYIFTTYQSYKGSLVSANGMYVLTPDGVILCDSPWDTTQFQPLLDSIEKKHQQKVKICIATHSHEDRTGGLEYYASKGIQTYTSRMTDSICRLKGQKRAAHLFVKDTLFTVGNSQFRTIYGGPGHAPDNIVIWFPKEKILYGGCLLKSSDAADLGNLSDASPEKWAHTMELIRKQTGRPVYTIPGHQSWQDNKAFSHTLKLLKDFQKINKAGKR